MPGLTSNQRAAVSARGNVLVLAGAGTGKTRTLVERCLERLLDATAPVSLDELLVVTFTEAAAGELRQRIQQRLAEELARQPENLHLAEQAALTETAPICTLHGFCLQLVREHFHELGLDPELTVLDEPQARILADRTLSELLNRRYAGSAKDDLAIQELVMTYGGGRDDCIRELVLQLHTYAQTLPDPDGWLAGQADALAQPAPAHWERWLIEGAAGWRLDSISTLEDAPADNPRALECLHRLSGAAPPTCLRDVASLTEQVLDLDGDYPKGKKTAWRKPIETLFDEAAFLRALVDADPSDAEAGPLREDWNWVRPHLAALVALETEFDRAFASAKRELAALDFHDLEQSALQLLWNRATGEPTPLARRWRERLRLIFVDEYQDINAAQDCLLRALSREGADGNRFLVGDVKQSIYRFRLANPHIFQRYADAWRASDADDRGTVIPLNENFRSRAPILDFVNALFAPLMRREVGGAAYDADARLRLGDRTASPACDPAPGPAVELLLRLKGEGVPSESGNQSPDGNETAEEDERSDAELEAALVAERLLALKAQPVMVREAQQGGTRPVEWRDMVVLLRAPATKAETYARIFEERGVPLWIKRAGLYETVEVSDLLSLLQLLDNPLQDIPTLAVLRSPLVGLTVNELAVVRLARRGEPFWTALARFHEERDGWARRESSQAAQAARASASPKVHRFLERYARWRELARTGSLSQCLETVLDETDYEAGLRRQPRGAQRVANVGRLLGMSRDFDRLQRQGLYRFLQTVAAQQAVAFDPEPAQIEATDAVRLMSIHQSKGLEFPVVAVADLGKPFNLRDLTSSVVLDEVYGLAPLVKPPETGRSYPSLPHWLASRRGRREALGEELRLWYVAATRAQEKLILVGTAPRTRAETRWTAPVPSISTPRLLGASNVLDWLGLVLPRLTGSSDWHQQPEGRSELLGWSIVEGPTCVAPAASDSRFEPCPVETREESLPSSGPPEATKLSGAPEGVSPSFREVWRYPHLPATREPAKASVTSLRRRALETEEAALWFEPRAIGPIAAATPPADSHSLTAAERGTAHHRVLELIKIEALDSARALADEVERLLQAGRLTEAEVHALDLEALAAFGQSELGSRIRRLSAFVRRELEFTVRLSPLDFDRLRLPCTAGLAADEFVVVQGVVDLAVIGPDSLWLLDFKTDAVTDASVADKVLAYTPQLRLYALALERLSARPATEAWLHFLTLNRSLPVGLTASG